MEGHTREFKVFDFFKYTILALMPILSIYSLFIFNVGTLLLVVIMLIEIILRKGNFEVNANLFIVIVFLGVFNILVGFYHMNVINLTGYINNSFGMFLFAVLCAYFVKNTIVNKDVFYQYIKTVALASSFFVFVQYFLYSRGIVVYGFIPFLESELIKSIVSISYGRPNSFFLEPAHYAIYVLPVYALSLLRGHYITGVVILLALFLSTSSTGIVIAIIITLLFLIKDNRIPPMIILIFAIIGIIALLPFVPFIKNSDVLAKLSFLSLKENIRVFGTLGYYKYLSSTDFLFGVGINQIQKYMGIFANISVKNYSNAFFFSFLSFGLVGGTIWNLYLASLYKLSRNKVLFIIFVLIYFTDQLLFNRNLFYLLLVLFVFSDGKDDLLKGSIIK